MRRNYSEMFARHLHYFLGIIKSGSLHTSFETSFLLDYMVTMFLGQSATYNLILMAGYDFQHRHFPTQYLLQTQQQG